MHPRSTALALVVVLLAACSSAPVDPPEPSPRVTASDALPTATATAADPASPPEPAAAMWRPVPPAPIAPREDHAAVWTGDRMLVWGGASFLGEGRATYADGAAYDPATMTWEAIPRAPVPGRTDPVAVWTGTELLVVGGSGADFQPRADGAAYDPDTATWRRLPPSPLGPRHAAGAVWTGTELLIWGGHTGDRVTFPADGAAYDPVTDSWRRVAEAPLSGRAEPVVVSTGGAVLVWGGHSNPDGRAPEGEITYEVAHADGARYDPAADTWVRMAVGVVPPRDADFSAAWTGEALLVWFANDPGVDGGPEGARYDAAADAWTALAPSGLTMYRFAQAEAWTGTHLVVWGGVIGEGGNHAWGDGAAYDAGRDRWEPLPETDLLGRRSGHSMVWTGTEVIVWGGTREDGEPGDVQYAETNSGAALTVPGG